MELKNKARTENGSAEVLNLNTSDVFQLFRNVIIQLVFVEISFFSVYYFLIWQMQHTKQMDSIFKNIPTVSSLLNNIFLIQSNYTQEFIDHISFPTVKHYSCLSLLQKYVNSTVYPFISV